MEKSQKLNINQLKEIIIKHYIKYLMDFLLKKIKIKIQKINKNFSQMIQEIDNQNVINTFCFKFLEKPQTLQVSPTAQLIKDVVKESSAKYHTSWCDIVRKSAEEIVLENFRLEYFKDFRKKFSGVKQFKMSVGVNDFLFKYYSYNCDKGEFREISKNKSIN